MPKAQEMEKNEEVDIGDEIVSWEAWDQPPHERTRNWYIVAGVIGVLLLIYAISSANFLFAIIVLMMGVILFVNNLKHPEEVQVYITELGILVGDEFYPFKEIKDFSVVYDPPHIKLLYVDFVSIWKPLLTIPLESVDPNEVREAILPYAFENLEREEETLTDMFRRLYKF